VHPGVAARDPVDSCNVSASLGVHANKEVVVPIKDGSEVVL
jgi:hypothetical protein